MELEQQVLQTVNAAITEAIKAKLVGYNSPLDALIKIAVDKNVVAIQAALDGAITQAVSGNFAVAMQDACAHKIAKVLISKTEGEIEKVANDLRASPEFRSRLTLTISNLVKEFTL